MDREETQRRACTEWEKLGISNDFMFGKVMQDPELCKGLLQRILPDMGIDRVEYPQLQKGIRPDADAKSVRLDVYVEDGKGTAYDMEMQVAAGTELPKRARYYQGMIDLQLIDRGQSYRRLKPGYIIFICLEDPFGKGRHRYTFVNVCTEDMGVALNDGSTKIFLNTDSSMDDVDSELRSFLDYAGGKKAQGEFVRRLDEAVKNARKNREWRLEYMTLLMRDLENYERGLEQGMEQGLEKGLEQGMERGLEQGLEQGMVKGLERGLEQGMVKGLEQGLEQGIGGTVSILRELGMPEEKIREKIKEKYGQAGVRILESLH